MENKFVLIKNTVLMLVIVSGLIPGTKKRIKIIACF